MSAPKTKSAELDGGTKKGIQLVVFAPINADPDDEDSKIYMVCPASLKVVEVIEKFDDEAEEYLALLGKNKKKTTTSSTEFTEEMESIDDISDDLIEDNSGGAATKSGNQLKSLDSELDEDIVTFASEALGDIFPDDGENSGESAATDVDLADALALLDEEDDESALEGLDDFKSDDESLPAL